VIEKARRTPCASLFLAASAALVFSRPGLAAHLQYERTAIAAGETWRLVSGHWTHYSLDHFVWDGLAFAALGIACERKSRSRFLVCLFASALMISLSVWLLLPEMQVYRGLSGIDSALFTFLAAVMWNDGRRKDQPGQQAIARACVIAFLLKVTFEMVTGNTVFVRGMGLVAVGVPLAHIVGAGCGLLAGINWQVVLRSSHTTQWSSTTSGSPRGRYGW
jgi:rhomboid family GlyGly-CTERM serine protease